MCSGGLSKNSIVSHVYSFGLEMQESPKNECKRNVIGIVMGDRRF